MTSSPSRRAVLRTAAWTTPAIAVATAAPAFAASNPSLFRVNIVGRRDGSVTANITNLTNQSITVRVVMAISQPQSNLSSISYSSSTFTITQEGSNVVMTATIAPSSTTTSFTISWSPTNTSNAGNFTFTTSSGAQTVTTSLPYAAPAAMRTKPQQPTGSVMRFGPDA